MRLLHTSTLKLEEFYGSIPRYAILSHTWESEEVSYQDLPQEHAKKMRGYRKVKSCCDQAARNYFDYVWIDTCCIDKRSSAELSEAINSMFSWYQNAGVCYAFLADVPEHDDPTSEKSAFRKSRWFTRGWTLQELLAPSVIIFYDGTWTDIGTKRSLRVVISEITSIDSDTLLGDDFKRHSVATRMSWASHRITTRDEDIAYCLMGIFGINMPILYGEGRAAFTRLQHNIIQSSYDHTIFAWMTKCGGRGVYRGMLAVHPDEFALSGEIHTRLSQLSVTPFSMTNIGLRIELPLIPHPLFGNKNTYIAVLDAVLPDHSSLLGIYLKRHREPKNQFSRIESRTIIRNIDPRKAPGAEVLYVQDRQISGWSLARQWREGFKDHSFSFERIPLHGDGFRYDKSQIMDKFASIYHKKDRVRVAIHNSHMPFTNWYQTQHVFKNRAGELFMVILGTKGGEVNKSKEVWVDILIPLTEDINPGGPGEMASYDSFKPVQYTASPIYSDQVLKPLPGHRIVSAILRETLGFQAIFYDVQISVKPYTPPIPLQLTAIASPRQTHDIFIVRPGKGLKLHDIRNEFAPKEAWKRGKNRSAVLRSTTKDDTNGSFLLSMFVWLEKVAITLGISNGRHWADVVKSTEPLESIRASYNQGGKRADVPALRYTRIVEPIDASSSIMLEIENVRYVGQEGNQARISMIDRVVSEKSSRHGDDEMEEDNYEDEAKDEEEEGYTDSEENDDDDDDDDDNHHYEWDDWDDGWTE